MSDLPDDSRINALQSEFLPTWLQFAARPSKSGQTRMRATIKRLYESLGLSAPQIIFCEGPIEKAIFPLMTHLMLKFGQEITESGEVSVLPGELPGVRNEWRLFWDKVRRQIDWEKEARQTPGLGDNLHERILRKVINRCESLLDAEVEPAIATVRFERLQRSFLRECEPAARGFLRATNFTMPEQAGLFQACERRLPESFRKQFHIELYEGSDARDVSQLPRHFADPRSLETLWLSFSNWTWLAHHSFFRTQLNIKIEAKADAMLDLVQRLHEAASLLCFQNACFVYLRPTSASFDPQWRMHRADRAAVEFVDYTKIFAWHGVEVDEKWITHPNSIKMRDIEYQTNVELRRIMIEIYGIDNYIRGTRSRVVDEDAFGTLYRADLPGDEPLTVVRVLNSTPSPDGREQYYFLRVPPETRSAREAVAWSFGMRPEDYKPDVET